MIEESINRRQLAALTSDHWHVVHARRAGEAAGRPRFERHIVSEHDDRAAAAKSAKALLATLAPTMQDQPWECCDHVFVRRPRYKSLKLAKHLKRARG